MAIAVSTAGGYLLSGPGWAMNYDPAHHINSDFASAVGSFTALSSTDFSIHASSTATNDPRFIGSIDNDGYSSITVFARETADEIYSSQDINTLAQEISTFISTDTTMLFGSLGRDSSGQLLPFNQIVSAVTAAINDTPIPDYEITMIIDDTHDTLSGILLTDYLPKEQIEIQSFGALGFQFKSDHVASSYIDFDGALNSPRNFTLPNGHVFKGVGDYISSYWGALVQDVGTPPDLSAFEISEAGYLGIEPPSAVIQNATVNGPRMSGLAQVFQVDNPYGGQDMLAAAQAAVAIAVIVIVTAGVGAFAVPSLVGVGISSTLTGGFASGALAGSLTAASVTAANVVGVTVTTTLAAGLAATAVVPTTLIATGADPVNLGG